MSTKHVRTTGDLARFKAALRIECLSCGNCRTVDGYELARAAGNGPLRAIEARLKCSRCGARQVTRAVLSPPPPR